MHRAPFKHNRLRRCNIAVGREIGAEVDGSSKGIQDSSGYEQCLLSKYHRVQAVERFSLTQAK